MRYSVAPEAGAETEVSEVAAETEASEVAPTE
jgi:hypothetical protein